ncbi:hypothetical protein OESDEN_23527 [Oesophagostomum dentatum]|uniref:MADF domain-containing protein n=1 Tax=Oesophagostomum dentatum TaxID=61180 RepID=A0A0B1RUU2_OESDE|nr:hypothetical protein OESDEN_23527 [Oesophagostomum dentatum]
MSLKVRYHWTTPLREALVKSVEKRETLWKKYPVVSHDIEMRAKLWGEVADELMEQFGILIDTEDMKKTWKNLKDNYWRITKAFESEPERAQRWKFYEIMRFMERATTGDQPDSRSNDDGPSSSNSKPESTSSIEIEEDDNRMKDVDAPSTSQFRTKEMPLQIVGMSGNSIRGTSRKKVSHISKNQ